MKQIALKLLIMATLLSCTGCQIQPQETLSSSVVESSMGIESSSEGIFAQETPSSEILTNSQETSSEIEPIEEKPITTLDFLDKNGNPLSNVTVFSEQFLPRMLPLKGECRLWEKSNLKQPLSLEIPQIFIVRDYISSKKWVDHTVTVTIDTSLERQQVKTNLVSRDRSKEKGSTIEVTIVDENGALVKDVSIECCRRDQLRPQSKQGNVPLVKFMNDSDEEMENPDEEMKHFEEEHYGCGQYTDESGKAYFVVEPNVEYNIYVICIYDVVHDEPGYAMDYVKSTQGVTKITIPIDLSE